MRWRHGRRSTNVEDRRGRRPRGRMLGGGIGTIILVLVGMYFGVDPALIMRGLQTANVSAPASGTSPSEEDPVAEMLRVVLSGTEEVWHEIFATNGRRYEEPTLVLFEGRTSSACGWGQAAMGPFYCPGDKKAYIDLSFFRDLRERYRAPGDFAQAYVIAHEVGHHVQNLLGISSQVQRMRQRLSTAEGNHLSVRLELQADCFAGLWARRAGQSGLNIALEQGDINEALTAAAAIGDDRLQKQARGTVAPDSFTHGTSAQRQRWFKTGFDSGDPDRCDTFATEAL